MLATKCRVYKSRRSSVILGIKIVVENVALKSRVEIAPNALKVAVFLLNRSPSAQDLRLNQGLRLNLMCLNRGSSVLSNHASTFAYHCMMKNITLTGCVIKI